jgi:ABC-type glycerol-3-phosphate transport system substrate-binding protein
MLRHRNIGRRQFVVGSAALLGSAALSARKALVSPAPVGAQTGPAVAKKVKLRWMEWPSTEVPALQRILDAFYKTDAGKAIEIERVTIPYAQYHDKMLALHLAGQLADVVHVGPGWLIEFATQGMYEPLDPYLAKAGKDWTGNLVQTALTPWKGAIYQIPVALYPYNLIVNEDRLAGTGFSGAPKTWAELESMGPKLTDPSKNLYCLASLMAVKSPYLGPQVEILPLIYQQNDTVLKHGKANINSPAALKALKFWLHLHADLKMYAPGVFTNIFEDTTGAFVAGQTALMWGNTAHVSAVDARKPKFKVGRAPTPTGVVSGTLLSGGFEVMNRKSRNKEAAWEFMAWLCGPDGSGLFNHLAKYLPGNTKADMSAVFAADPRMKIDMDTLAQGRAFMETAILPQATDLFRILTEQIQEAASDRKSPEDALAFVEAEWSKVIAKYA